MIYTDSYEFSNSIYNEQYQDDLKIFNEEFEDQLLQITENNSTQHTNSPYQNSQTNIIDTRSQKGEELPSYANS